ncbi:MAG TPA: hypothetical protein DHW45_05985, partial [Candidatus Latescibacteria bacterium]|nr:hypothetical protein [Candidatus Latescibacterota bacterium]
MKQRLLSFIAVALALFLAPGTSKGQTVTLTPAAVPNGIALASGEQYHQRMEIRFGGTSTSGARGITITVPAELNVITASITSTGSVAAATFNVFYAGSPSSQVLNFAVSGTAASRTATIEFDVTTPANFAGVATGTKVDTVYQLAIASTLGSNQTVAVAKHNNLPIREVSFSAPHATNGDTTQAGGRFYKLAFSSLPDLSHRDVSGLSRAASGAATLGLLTDASTDVLYSFYLSTDSSLIERPQTLGEVAFFTSLATVPAGSNVPLLGTRQNPRVVDRTYIREDFSTVWSTAAGDSVAGIISLAGTQDNTTYYVYALADPSPDRIPAIRLVGTNGGSLKKGFEPSVRGAFSGGVFLGRSGPLFVQHPPEFIVAGWDYDNDTDDDFATTGVVQIPSDIINMGITASNRKDNVNATIDTGEFFGKSTAGTALASLNSGLVPGPIPDISLLYVADDSDNPSDFQMNVILSTNSGLGVADLVGTGIDSFNVASSIRIPGTDTLTAGFVAYKFDPIVRDGVTNLINSYVPEGAYNVYFVATDGTHRTVYQVVDDPYSGTPLATQLRVRHSPNIQQVDAFSLNDFDGDGDLDVVTGIDVSQMMTDTDGMDLSPGPAQRYVNIFWGNAGLDADLDVDDNATIDLYYSTRSTFRAVGGSAAYTSGNSDGTDLLSAMAQGNNDTHLLARGIQEDPDGLFDDSYAWDIWNYVSPEGTIPRTGVRYYIYGLLSGGNTRRMESFTSSGGIVFEHPPYARVIEPSQDLTVTVDEPVSIQWEAFDVDNSEQSGLAAVPLGQSGRISPNSSFDSPNIRILLTSSDFGEVTTWGSITAATQQTRFWVGNSCDGSLGSEVELNEGVDTAFVIQGNRLRNSLGAGASSASLELQTNSGLGHTYFVYVAIDQGGDQTVANQPVNFAALSPVVRAPGRITFTGSVPQSPSTSARFTMPTRMTAVSNQTIQFPIIPDEGDASGSTDIDVVDLFLTVDPDLFEAIDTDAATPGVQPFVLGGNTQILESNVSQAAYIDGSGLLRLDFIYSTGGGSSGHLDFFDGEQILATANLRALPLSGNSTVNTTISLDNTGTRVSKMIAGSTTLGIANPAPTSVDIVRLARVSGTVPLQGRTSSADTVTIHLREVGDLRPVRDSLFTLNDQYDGAQGVQILTEGVTGAFTLNNVPSGRWILTAFVPRHLVGHDTLNIEGGLDVVGFQPTLDGQGVDRTELLAGDAAGYSDSTGANLPDNAVNTADINAVNDALFSQPGDSNFNTFADINRDGIVNGTDKDFTSVNKTSNTGSNSEIVPVFPNFKQAVVEGDNAEAVLMLKDLPTSEIAPGEEFDVTIAVEGAVAVRTYEFHLSYDPEMIEVADLVSQGTLFKNYRFDIGGKNEGGALGLVNSILGKTPVGASGEGTLATIRFRAVNRSVETSLALTDAMLINVDHTAATPQLSGGATIVLSSDPIAFHDAAGERVLGLILADQ